ncbi:MAG TPA: hypothetical protein VFI79_05945 [Gemmatimonadales bacterium]|nr:hypothetical protein [Gemmatimonadales bacterium]
MVSGLTAFFTVSGCVIVARRTGCFVVVVVRWVDVVVDRVVVLRTAGLVVDGVAAVDSRDADDERAADCRLGLDAVQAAKPISKSPARRILDISPPTAGSPGAR